MKLVPDWRDSWRWISMHAQVAQVAVLATWAGLPDDFRSSVPPHVLLGITAAVATVGVAGRLADQSKPS
jgi:hypothetical protein